MRLTVILPTYNERENIVGILERITSILPESRILVVDDASPDGTGGEADRVAERLGGVEVIHRAAKEGLGSAYRFAFEKILLENRDDRETEDPMVVVTMDADFSHDPAVIPAMLDRISGGADAIVGSRYVPGGGTKNWPVHRRLLSRWGNRYTAWVLGVPVRDCTSGFRAYRLEALRVIEPQSTTAEGYAFLTELVVRLHRAGFRLEEEPILFIDRTAGSSKMSRAIIVESMTLVTRWGISRRLGRGDI